eukprot:13513019-Heterocapsa_arctica.AAC.1
MAALWIEAARSGVLATASMCQRDHERLDRETSVDGLSPCSCIRAILARARASLAESWAFSAIVPVGETRLLLQAKVWLGSDWLPARPPCSSESG